VAPVCPSVRWGLVVAGAVLIGGSAHVRGEVVCYEKQVEVDVKGQCVNITFTPLAPDNKTLQQLETACRDRLARQQAALREEHARQCTVRLEQEGQRCNEERRQMTAAQAEQRAGLADRLRLCEARVQTVTDDRDQLQTVVAAVKPVEPTDFEGMGLLFVIGMAGLLLGLLGHSSGGTEELLMGALLSAAVALLIFWGMISLMPVTLPHLLFAAATAILAVTLRALMRAYVLLRRYGRP
jgi:hypothetical protein